MTCLQSRQPCSHIPYQSKSHGTHAFGDYAYSNPRCAAIWHPHSISVCSAHSQGLHYNICYQFAILWIWTSLLFLVSCIPLSSNFVPDFVFVLVEKVHWTFPHIPWTMLSERALRGLGASQNIFLHLETTGYRFFTPCRAMTFGVLYTNTKSHGTVLWSCS